jgi:hypothetical protein
MKQVVVHIGRLVLKGFQYEGWRALPEGLREKLPPLFAEPCATWRLLLRRDLSRLKMNAVQIKPEAKPSGIGAQAARSTVWEIKS